MVIWLLPILVGILVVYMIISHLVGNLILLLVGNLILISVFVVKLLSLTWLWELGYLLLECLLQIMFFTSSFFPLLKCISQTNTWVGTGNKMIYALIINNISLLLDINSSTWKPMMNWYVLICLHTNFSYLYCHLRMRTLFLF